LGSTFLVLILSSHDQVEGSTLSILMPFAEDPQGVRGPLTA
jgi:hypothetical protein